MSKFDALQYNVFDRFDELRHIALPDDAKYGLEQGNYVQWPSARGGATDVLRHEPERRVFPQLASLVIDFGEAATGLTFQRDTGKIVLVSRMMGEVSVGSIIRSEIRKIFVPRERPDPTDYEILFEELQAGIKYFNQEEA